MTTGANLHVYNGAASKVHKGDPPRRDHSVLGRFKEVYSHYGRLLTAAHSRNAVRLYFDTNAPCLSAETGPTTATIRYSCTIKHLVHQVNWQNSSAFCVGFDFKTRLRDVRYALELYSIVPSTCYILCSSAIDYSRRVIIFTIIISTIRNNHGL